jgi:hypothetical protein
MWNTRAGIPFPESRQAICSDDADEVEQQYRDTGLDLMRIYNTMDSFGFSQLLKKRMFCFLDARVAEVIYQTL